MHLFTIGYGPKAVVCERSHKIMGCVSGKLCYLSLSMPRPLRSHALLPVPPLHQSVPPNQTGHLLTASYI